MTDEEHDAMREARYRAMRERAAKRGIELPETPPWKLMSPEERKARWEQMRNLSPEERRAMRDQHWAELRKRAAEKGTELPETPPWRQAEQRREEMQSKWEEYRKIVEQMSDEQREAAEAVFGTPPSPPPTPPRGAPMQGPYGGYYGPRVPPQMPQQMPPQGYMAPDYGGQRGPSMYPGGQGPWYGGEESMMPPPPPQGGYNQPW